MQENNFLNKGHSCDYIFHVLLGDKNNYSRKIYELNSKVINAKYMTHSKETCFL